MDLAAPRQGGRFFSRAFGRDFPRLPSRKTMDSRTPGPQSQPPRQKSSSGGQDSDQQSHPTAKFVPSPFERCATNNRLSEAGGEEAGDGIGGLHSSGGSMCSKGFGATKDEKASSGSKRKSLKKKTAGFARPHLLFGDSLLQDVDVSSYARNPAATAGGCGSYDFPEPASQVDQRRLREKLAQLVFQESISDWRNGSGSDGEDNINEGGGGGHCPVSFSSAAPTFSVVDPEASWEASWERALDGDLICGSDFINSHNVLRIPRDVFASRSHSVCPSPAGPPSHSFRSIFSNSSHAELPSIVKLHGPFHADGAKVAAAAASAGIGASTVAPGGGAESGSAAAESTVVLEEGDHDQVTPRVPSASTAASTGAPSSSHSSRPSSPLLCAAAGTPSSSPSLASMNFPGSSPASTATSGACHCIGFKDASPGPSFTSNSEQKDAPVLGGSKASPQQGSLDFAGVPQSSAAAIPHRKSLSAATMPRLASAASVSILPSFEQRRRLAVEAEAEDARQCQAEAPNAVDVPQRQTPSASAEAATDTAEGAVAVECQTACQSQAVAAAAAWQAHKGTREGLRHEVRRGYTMPLERSRDGAASAGSGHGRSLTVSSVEQGRGAAAQTVDDDVQANAAPAAAARSQCRSKTAPCEREECCQCVVVFSRVYPSTVGAKASASTSASMPGHRLPSLWVSIPEVCPEEEAVTCSDMPWGPQTVDRSSSLNCGSSRARFGGCLEGLSLSVAGKGNEGKGVNVGASEGVWGPQTMDRISRSCHRRLRVWDGFECPAVVEREDAWAVAP